MSPSVNVGLNCQCFFGLLVLRILRNIWPSIILKFVSCSILLMHYSVHKVILFKAIPKPDTECFKLCIFVSN